MKKLSDIQVLNMMEAYKNGSSLSQLGRIFGVTHTAISGLLSRRGVPIRSSKVILTDAQKKEILDEYRGGEGSGSLARRFRSSQRWMWEFISKSIGTRTRRESNGSRRIHFFNERYFQTIDTSEKAYILGFVCADGHNSGSFLKIGLARKDKSLLVSIARALGDETLIKDGTVKYKGKSFPTVSIHAHSQNMAADLKALGVDCNKTKRLSLPEINSIWMPDFIRGYFDGDGCVYLSRGDIRARWDILCTRKFCKQIKKILQGFGVVGLYEENKGVVVDLATSTISDIYLMYNVMYGNNPSLFLQRKRDKFERYFEQRRLRCLRK